jgi:spore maturation protein CgeB
LVLNYSTDDPWNPAYRATWFMEALRRYTTVFTPRADTLDDFRQLGCRDVRVLPFAFDTQLIPPMPEHRQPPDCDILFVGGADRDRVPIMQAVAESGLKLKLFGGYWDRHPVLKRYWAGNCDIRTIVAETWRAPVNICLVRRANRDGHVMRTFEIAAAGGFIVAEDTADHRRIFGGDGECVLYFRTVPELIAKAVWALEHPAERERMAVDARRRITAGGNTYLDRLRTMLSASGGPVQTRASAGSGGGVPCPEPLF